jgi:hypothetical protein
MAAQTSPSCLRKLIFAKGGAAAPNGWSVRGGDADRGMLGRNRCPVRLMSEAAVSRYSGQYGATAGSSVVLAPMRAAAVLPLRAAGTCEPAAARPKTGMLP